MDKITRDTQFLYDHFSFGKLSYGKKRERYYPLLFDFLAMIKKDDTLFDLGCGNGFWIDAYLKKGIRKERITGVDISPNNVAELKKKGFKVVCDNLMQLQLKDDIADFTICNGVIQHTSNPKQAFRELARITKPGGYIYITVYNKWHLYYYLVHKAAYPLRYLYWNWNKKVVEFIFPAAKLIFQMLAYFSLGEWLDEKSAKVVFMDQVIVPRAHLFSKSMLVSYARACNCQIEKMRYIKYGLMISAIIKRKRKEAQVEFI